MKRILSILLVFLLLLGWQGAAAFLLGKRGNLFQ